MAIYNSELFLMANVELDPNHEYSIDFDSYDEQRDYFRPKVLATVPAGSYTYIRKDDVLRVDANVDDILKCNYLAYRNEDDKLYFCFITDKKYVNEETTDIYFKIDPFQTFMFDYELGECFVEREHQDRFKIGEIDPSDGSDYLDYIFNTNSEDIGYGDEYKRIQSKIDAPYMTSDNLPILFAYCYVDSSDTSVGLRASLNGIVTGYSIVCYPIVMDRHFVLQDKDWSVYFYANDVETKDPPVIDYLMNNFQINPKTVQILLSPYPPENWSYEINSTNKTITFLQSADSKNIYYYVETPVSAGKASYGIGIANVQNYKGIGYNKILIPNKLHYPQKGTLHTIRRNKAYESKMLTYPFKFNKINLNGKEIILKNEYIDPYDGIEIEGYQSLSTEGTSCLRIENYLLNNDKYNEDMIISNQLPMLLDISTDKWKQYMIDNKNQRLAGFISDAAGLTTGIATGVIANALTGGAASIGMLGAIQQGVGGFASVTNKLAKERDIKNQSADVKKFNGDIHMSFFISDNKPILTKYEITEEYENKVYNFFYHFGYKVDDFKVPDTRSRYYFNFIKNSLTTIKSDINTDYIDELKDIYNKGITIWHKRADWYGVQNYTYENAEMSSEV